MNNDEDPLIAEAPLATRRQSVSPRACLLCALSLLVFACIVGAIVVPVVLLLADAPSLAPTSLRCATSARELVSMRTDHAFNTLSNITSNFGHREVGSAALEAMTSWARDQMAAEGLANAKRQNVTVRVWKRPHTEKLTLLGDGTRADRSMQILSLGNSVNGTVEAEVLCVTSEDELKSISAAVKGRIVLFNNVFKSYGESVYYRSRGPSIVRKLGGVAVLVRSVTPQSLYTPHTGATQNLNASEMIPAVAVTIEDADLMARLQRNGHVLKARLELIGDTNRLADGSFGTALSHNVMAEIVGSELPKEVVVLGGHVDSWDVGQGALDDGTGFVAAWSAVHMIHKLGLKPRRTIRVVGWTNEENGGAGSKYYASHVPDDEITYFAFESDGGTNAVKGINLHAPADVHREVNSIAELLEITSTNVVENATSAGSTGADISPLVSAGSPGAGLIVDTPASKYFWYHHTNADTLDKVVVEDLHRAVSTLAIYAYCVADSILTHNETMT